MKRPAASSWLERRRHTASSNTTVLPLPVGAATARAMSEQAAASKTSDCMLLKYLSLVKRGGGRSAGLAGVAPICSDLPRVARVRRPHRKLPKMPRKHDGSSAVVRGASRAFLGGAKGGRADDAGVKVGGAEPNWCCGGPPSGTPAPCWRLRRRHVSTHARAAQRARERAHAPCHRFANQTADTRFAPAQACARQFPAQPRHAAARCDAREVKPVGRACASEASRTSKRKSGKHVSRRGAGPRGRRTLRERDASGVAS